VAGRREARRDASGRFGSEAVPMRPAGERAAARERDERLALIVGRPRRGLRAVVLLAVLVVAIVVALLAVGRAGAAAPPTSAASAPARVSSFPPGGGQCGVCS